MKTFILIISCLFITGVVSAQKILIPMDQTQSDHLKAYGIAFWTLKQGQNVDWLLNYRGGSFMVDFTGNVVTLILTQTLTLILTLILP